MEKLKELKIKWLSLREEYREEYPYGSDNSTNCTILLDKIKAIETTFNTLGLRVQDYEANHFNVTNVSTSYYSCMDCEWGGEITECDFDTEYDEFKGIDRKYPICPKCSGGLDC